MLHFEGTEQFPTGPAAVFAYLADPARLARALPEHQVTGESAESATWKVRPKFAFMAGTLDTTATVLAARRGSRCPTASSAPAWAARPRWRRT